MVRPLCEDLFFSKIFFLIITGLPFAPIASSTFLGNFGSSPFRDGFEKSSSVSSSIDSIFSNFSVPSAFIGLPWLSVVALSASSVVVVALSVSVAVSVSVVGVVVVVVSPVPSTGGSFVGS